VGVIKQQFELSELKGKKKDKIKRWEKSGAARRYKVGHTLSFFFFSESSLSYPN